MCVYINIYVYIYIYKHIHVYNKHTCVCVYYKHNIGSWLGNVFPVSGLKISTEKKYSPLPSPFSMYLGIPNLIRGGSQWVPTLRVKWTSLYIPLILLFPNKIHLQMYLYLGHFAIDHSPILDLSSNYHQPSMI